MADQKESKGNAKKFKVVFNGIKKEAIAEGGNKFSKFINNLIRQYAGTALLKKEFKLEKIKQCQLFILAGSAMPFTAEELDVLRNYLEGGGNVLLVQGEGGDEKTGTNLNEFLKDYGISFHGDSVVRTAYYKYMHPKECFIDTMKVHPSFLKSIKTVQKKKIDVMGEEDDTTEDEAALKICYPFGQSIDVPKKGNVSVVFNSGIIAYPLKRALCTACKSKSGKGKLVCFGSVRFFENDYIEKEENKRVAEGLIKFLLGMSSASVLDPSKQVEIADYTYIPNIISLSDKVKSCLEEAKEPPRNFNDLFDLSMFKIDNNLVPEAIELYEKLNVKHEVLSIIPPQFETPLPPLQLAVFDPIIRDFPVPNLELFDLDEQFAGEKTKLAQATNKCTDEDLEYYILQCSDILGISGKIENKNDPKAVLAYVMKEVVKYKKLNP
ncbi:MAG: GldG family protein [archaeon]|nr:GldG family protein [archaeon]